VKSNSAFLLEDEYNRVEALALDTISSGLFPSLSLIDILSRFDEIQRLQLLESWLSLKLDYSEQYGLERLRSVIATRYCKEQALRHCERSEAITHENILITSGASEAIYLIFSVLASPDACFIVQKPIYQSLYQVAADRGARIIDWDYDAALSPDENIDLLEKLIASCSKLTALVLNNPNNPMGIVITDTAMQRIAGLLEPQQARLIVDEVFRPSSLVPVSSAINYGAIVIGDISKSYSCPGLRLGWIAARDQELLAQCSSLKNYLSLRSSTLSEHIAVSVIEQGDWITERNMKIAAANLAYLRSVDFELDAHPDYIGGPVLFPRLSSLDSVIASPRSGRGNPHTTDDIFIVRGDLFGNYSDRFRLGLGQESLSAVIASPRSGRGNPLSS